MKTITTLLLLASCVTAQAESTKQTYRNSNGQIVGSSTTNNAGTKFYNPQGQNTGRSVTNNAGTTFYNSSGQMTGRASSSSKR
jgi:hypothetical protein